MHCTLIHIAYVIFKFWYKSKIIKFIHRKHLNICGTGNVCMLNQWVILLDYGLHLRTVLSHSQTHTHNTDQQPSPGHMVQSGCMWAPIQAMYTFSTQKS